MQLLGPPIADEEIEQRMDALVRRHARAENLGMQLLNAIGGSAAGLLDRLPREIRGRLDGATAEALRLAMEGAHRSRSVVGSQPGWLNRAVTTAMGAAGGFGGLPTAMAELPVTTAILLRTIQDVAEEHGFDPEEESVRFDCVQVFAAAGPLDRDDDTDFAFLGTRIAVSGAAVHTIIARVAPRLATVLGQKLAAQTIPVLGAAAGAATNYAFTGYYSQMAHVHFGLRQLAIEADRDHEELVAEFRRRVVKPPVKRA
ncbi:EcsC family protein [Roseovarius sp. SCSIO 43702]|uniref:EcsC family protein n=1 Tax=Roseovarius sp. SCSIO 43702 TaxID=2823043 RepID=UPI001C72FCA7|nr:EcsC family protein [Roseovarius sp. SCSIO 43702]QYX57850.1 EcsC family protein [Roseovarius sp. SCSIO 43702]